MPAIIDGVLLNGYLPARFGFVIKGEMRDIPVVHFLLRRSGSKFVERKEASRAVRRDARQLVQARPSAASRWDFSRKARSCWSQVSRVFAQARSSLR